MKKKILILGYSSFFRRRVLPSISKIKNLKIFICSKSNKINLKKNIYLNDYNTALSKLKYDLIYISLINPMHYYFAKKALMNGNNVIVDKPITLNFIHTKKLINLAKKKKLLLSELTIFNHHLIFEKILKLIGGIKNLELIQSNFNIPKTKNLNEIRFRKNDCMQDMSPYAAAIIRIFLKGKINKFLLRKKYFKKKKIVKEFSLFTENKNVHFFGNFGISKEYLSKITFFGQKKIIEIPFQAFALSSKKPILINYKKNNISKNLYLKDDYIKRIFKKVLFGNFKKSYFLNNITMDNNIKKKLNLFN